PVLGLTAAMAALLLLIVGLFSSWSSSSRIGDGAMKAGDAGRFLTAAIKQRDVIRAMNMDTTVAERWHGLRLTGIGTLVEGSDITSVFRAISVYIRQLAQMAMLGLGAYLAIYDKITPGVIVAGSIICARALGPLDQAFKKVRNGYQALLAFRRLRSATEEMIDRSGLAPLPKPWGTLEVEEVSVRFEDQEKPALSDVSFRLEPNSSLGIVGPAGAGKSVLAKLLVGALTPSSGRVSLGGHDLHRHQDGRIGEHIGYVAQRISLIDGSVLDNITRFRSDDLGQAIRAAERVGVHPLIEQLPHSYDTSLRLAAKYLTPSQLRMIEFARAAFGDPTLIILDKADVGLDGAGIKSLQRLITWGRRKERILIMASDRQTYVRDFDHLMVLWNGTMEGLIKPEKLLNQMQELKQVTSGR
ncbi:MAG: ATP-binding cassette domain-containing protein, partial [Geminicoccaceae bacterium]